MPSVTSAKWEVDPAISGIAGLGVVRSIAEAKNGGAIRPKMATDPAGTLAIVGVAIEGLARMYAGTWNTPQDAAFWDEAAMFVCGQFAHLSVAEISNAFQLAAAGKIGDRKDLAAYAGEWSIAGLGAVLGAYDKHRKDIIRQADQVRESARRRAEETGAVRGQPPAGAKTAEDEQIARLIAGQVKPEHYSSYLFRLLGQRGLLKFEKEEWRAVLARAEARVMIECATAMLEGRERAVWARNMKAQIEGSEPATDQGFAHIRRTAEIIAIADFVAAQKVPF